MKERPILFSAPMILAILDGRKTMTRRVIKPQPAGDEFGGFNMFGEAIFYPRDDNSDDPGLRRQPYGQPGDRLWVREAWWHHKECRPPFEHTGPQGCVRYEASEAAHATELGRWLPEWYERKSPIFMPRWASRLTLEITAVRVERVQDISEEDARAEGCDGYVGGEGPVPESALAVEPGYWHPNFFRDGFRFVWDSLNAKRGYGWDANPWAWVISFRRLP